LHSNLLGENMYHSFTSRIRKFSTQIAIVGLILSVFPGGLAQASQITARSLTLGSPISAASTTHKFTFTVVSATVIKAVRFQYCTTATGTCTNPAGPWANTGGTLGTVSNLGSGFAIDLSTNSDSYGITSAANATAPSAGISVTINSAKNPTSSQPYTWYVRISTYSGVGYTGALDTGVVAAALSQAIVLTGVMPESLIFCTGGTITGTDCTTATSGSVSFNAEFSPAATTYTTSQMVASTNAGTGYAITVNGATMTSGGNTVPAMSPATTSTIGTGQFGLNVMVNTTPVVGTTVTPAANGTNYKDQGNTGYDTANTFKFLTGDTVASSTNGGAGPTDAQNMTVSYIVNVSGSQTAGTYTSTLTYICTATY
jgi:hypothetical protein